MKLAVDIGEWKSLMKCFPRSQDGAYEVTTGQTVGLFAGLLIFHGLLVCCEI